MDTELEARAFAREEFPVKQNSTAVSLLAGSIGGASQVIVGQPLDTIKTRAQIAPKGLFKGPMDIATQTVRREGFLALYKGMMSPLLGVAAVNSLLFGSFTVSKRIVSPYPDLSTAQTATAGAMAGAITALLASPVEMFKILMQGQYGSPQDKKLGQVAMELWRAQGFKNGIMRGYWVTVAREIPAYSGFYVGYETTKRYFTKRLLPAGSKEQLPTWALLTAGGMGGMGYWTACYPLDVLKSKVQMAPEPPKSISYVWKGFGEVAAKEGWGTFIRGLTPTYLRAVPAAGATFAAFEISSEWLNSNTNL